MPATDAGWIAQTAAAWTIQLRDALDTALGFANDYDGTIEGDWTATIGELAFSADEGFQIAIDNLDPRTATGSALDRAVAPLLRQPASKSRYTCDVVTDVAIPVGAQFRDDEGQTWVAVAARVAGDPTTGFIVEALEAGVYTLSQVTTTTLEPVTALPTPTDLTYTPGDTYLVGKAVETDSELRRRWSVSLGRPNAPTGPGMYRTLLAITWVTAASVVRTGAGEIAVYVVPAPVGADQEAELAEAIYDCVGAAVVTTGSDSAVVEGVDGQDVTIYWTAGTTQNVTIAVVATLASGVALADVEAAITSAVQGQFDVLDVGATLYRLQVLGALADVAGVLGVTLTINGSSSANAVPSLPTDLLVLSTLTIS